MFLTFLIIGCLLLSVMLNTFIKGVVYSSIPDHDEVDEEEVPDGLILTALGVLIISNLIPFTFGAIIGLYAIL
jgi:hypothetical protein